MVDGDGDFDCAVEIRSESKYCVSFLRIVSCLDDLLELAKLVATEFLSLFGDVDPETTIAADGRGTFDSEAHSHGIFSLGGEINVLALDLRRAIIIQGQ